jgi:hypothetical protein
MPGSFRMPSSKRSRGLIGLGCSSAQPRKCAAPIFPRISSAIRRRSSAPAAREPAGHLAARELEIQRISSALRRAGDRDDVAAEAGVEAA